MTRLRQVIDAAAVALAEAGVGSPRTDAELLAAHAAGTDRGSAHHHRSRARNSSTGTTASWLCARSGFRCNTSPAPRHSGPVTVHVGPGVFIPRPETESMLEWALAQPLSQNAVIVDLCTGSGALALALSNHWPDARIIAVDDSEDALDYARRNVAGTPVELIRADVTRQALLSELHGGVDLVVANPPYIPDGAILEPEVAEHDPAHALFGGPDGMTVINADRRARGAGGCATAADAPSSTTTPRLN